MQNTNDMSVKPVILCGGSGTRLWPVSRTEFPKQFLRLTGKNSLFQQTVQRLAGLGHTGNHVATPAIVSSEAHQSLVVEQLDAMETVSYDLWLEPVGRNTAPALSLVALSEIESGIDPVLVVAPADHVITEPAVFHQVIHRAVAEAATGAIVILGITPDRPETGYGYIQVAAATAAQSQARLVTRFVEKPAPEQAQYYLQEGHYWWNAGLFVLKASIWLQALRQFRPDIAKATESAWQKRTRNEALIRPGQDEFAAIPAESIDYAVIEQCPGSQFAIQAVPLEAGWSDLGTWESVWQHAAKDTAGNVCSGDVLSRDSHQTLVHATSRLVSLVGVQNLIVVETPDVVLVADKSQPQAVKKLVGDLIQQDRTESRLHRKIHRPWGWYDTLEEGPCFKVKRIQVKPQASLSLQMHHHRAEHWVVVSGVAEVTRGDQVFQMVANQSTYIPCGVIHRLANTGEVPLEIIEVQSGEYLSEEDIVRLEDAYGRVTC